GYCLLGRLIEHSAGKDYVDAVRELLELPMDSGLTLGPPPSGVLREGHSLTDNTWVRTSSAGGWFSDAETLASLFSRDARDSSIATMTTAPHNDSYYGLGWRVWPQGETYRLTHFGSLPGMFSVAVAYPDGCTAVMLLNDRPKN